jgi:uncharacterized protein (TIGR02118 family)
MVKQIFTIKRKKGMSFEDFKKHYMEVHAPLVKKSFPEIRKYIVNLVLQRGKETPFDAVTEICWDDIDTIVRVAKSDTFKNVIMADEEKFIDRSSAVVVLTEETIQK